MANRLFTNDDFDIEFDINFSSEAKDNTGEIIIYNLTNSTIENISTAGGVMLNVGYGFTLNNIISGRVDKPITTWSGVDKKTTVIVSDRVAVTVGATVSKTYNAGSKASMIFKDLAEQANMEIAEIELPNDIEYPRGKVLFGSVPNMFEALAKETGSKFYVNKGKIFIRPPEKGTYTGFLLNSDSGLLSSPERQEEEKDGKKILYYNVQCLLNGKITTDSLVRIESKTVNGNFRVVNGSHKGNFVTEFKAVQV